MLHDVKQLTVRSTDPALDEALERLATSRGISLNKAALQLMKRGAGLGESRADSKRIGARLDRFVGGWSDEEAEFFERAVADFERIDEGMWGG